MVRRTVLAAVALWLCGITSAQEARPSAAKVYVVGQVLRSGTYVLGSPTTVLKALVDAGGFRENAAVEKIEIVRGQSRLKFNYTAVIAKEARDQNVILRDGDIIVVP